MFRQGQSSQGGWEWALRRPPRKILNGPQPQRRRLRRLVQSVDVAPLISCRSSSVVVLPGDELVFARQQPARPPLLDQILKPPLGTRIRIDCQCLLQERFELRTILVLQ